MSLHPAHFEVLPNGLGVLLRESHAAPVAAVQIWAKVGSADERPEEAGLAHFHEHMLFKGTARRGVGEVAGDVEGVGGRINAYTSFDVTVYHATLPSAELPTGVDVLVDAVRHSIFDPTELAREIDVVLEEIRRSEDTPSHVLSDAIFAEAFQVHPYRNPILGTTKSVSSFDRERVMTFFRRWYTPDNLVFVAAGDFDAPELAARVREAFADAAPGGTRPERPREPEQRGLRSVVLARPFERASLELSFHGARFREREAVHLDLLGYILGEGDSSRLVRQVKEREGLADRIDAGSYTPLDPGLFGASVELDSERAPAAIEAVCRELERVRIEGVSRDELERARANFLASEHFERESVGGLARKLGGFHVLGGDWRGEDAYLQTVREATPEDLHAAARRFLDPERLTVGTLLPEEDAGVLDATGVRGAVERGVGGVRRAFAGPTPRGRASDVQSYTLPNGVRLHVVPRRGVPVVAVRAALLGGLLVENEKTAGLTSFTAQMWLRGTRSRSAADLARSIDALAAEIDGFSGRNSLGLTLDVTSDRLEPALELFSEVLLDPAFDSEELERERRDTLAALERREDHLGAKAFDLFTAEHYRTHPYRFPVLGLEACVRGFTAETLAMHHARWVRPENLVLGVVGDVDPDAVATRLGVGLGGLEATGFEAPCPEPEPAPREIRVAELRKDRAQAHLVLGFRGLTIHDEDRHALEIVSQLLAGQGGRLFLELRDRQGLAYSVSAMNIEGVAPGFFSTYIATAPENLEAAKAGMLLELRKLLEEGPGADELDRARRYLVGNAAIDEQRATVRASHVALDALYGLGPDDDRRYAERIRAVGRDDVLRVARNVLDLSSYTLAVIKP